MFVESSSKLHDWPLTFGKVYLVLQKFVIGDGFIYLIVDDKQLIKPYHSSLFKIIT